MTNRTARMGVLAILAAMMVMMGAVCNMPLLGGSTDVQQVQSSCPGKTTAEIQSLIDMAKGLDLGGTSKAVFIRGSALPRDRETRDAVILSLFGSPDRRQVDGLGGTGWCG